MKKQIAKHEIDIGILNAILEISLESKKVKDRCLGQYNITDLVLSLNQLTDGACESRLKIYSVSKESLLELSNAFKKLAQDCPE